MSFYFHQTQQQEEDGAVYGPKGGEECLLEGRGECETENGVLCNADMTDLNNDTADAESGVEPDSTDWIYQETNESVEFDITAEQAMATLQYFTSTAERANIMTKTHHDDLDVISGLLQEKEKDLEMAARIGQSLLQRNKHLLLKIEAMEDYMNCVSERENQMRHEVATKNDILKRMLQEEQDYDLYSENGNSVCSGDSGCKDESIVLLEKKCKNLELQNHELLNEAVTLKEMANDAEDQEQDLVVDCMQHLAFAKDQITHLTDEIALKFEDNVAQQEEITQLISTVVELQRKQKQLAIENEDLQYQLEDSQINQEYLRSQVIDMERRFRECFELLEQNQDEVKTLREKVEHTEHGPWKIDEVPLSISKHESLALEIEETVKRELTASDRKEKTSRVLHTVKKANQFLSPGSSRAASTTGNMSSAVSLKSQSSIDSDCHSIGSFSKSWAGSDIDDARRRKGYIPAEKLQIIKPMEGSITLHKWHHLASENVVAGLNVGNVLTPLKNTDDSSRELSQNSLTDYASTLQNNEPAMDQRLQDFQDEDVDETDDDDDDFGITFKAKKNKTGPASEKKQSTPVHASQKSLQDSDIASDVVSNAVGLGALSGGSKRQDRTIITRNSSVLNCLREGRAMLNKDGGDGKSRSDAIDILANAMSKANIEAKTGQRILKSMNSGKSRSRASSNASSQPRSQPRKDYPDMPKLNKVLEKLSVNSKSGKVDLSAVQPALQVLLEKAAAGSEKAATAKRDDVVEKVEKPEVVLPSILRGPANMRPAGGLLGNILQSKDEHVVGNSMLTNMLSTTLVPPAANLPMAKTGLTRSWSSGDLNSFSKENIAGLNVFNANNSDNELRANSSTNNLASLAKTGIDQPLGMRRRTNSSGSLSELIKQADFKASSGSPPDHAAFMSFDSYGVSDFSSQGYGSSKSAGKSQETTTASNKPGFLRSLFLGSSTSSEKPAELKRTSSATDMTSGGITLGAGSSASVETGMDRFGKTQESSGKFGFSFMSYFGGSKKTDTK